MCSFLIVDKSERTKMKCSVYVFFKCSTLSNSVFILCIYVWLFRVGQFNFIPFLRVWWYMFTNPFCIHGKLLRRLQKCKPRRKDSFNTPFTRSYIFQNIWTSHTCNRYRVIFKNSFINSSREGSINHFLNSEDYMTKYQEYKLIPDPYEGCVDV